MANKSQKFIYALQAVYEGKGEMAQLTGDLKAVGQIESFQKLQGDFSATTTSLVAAKARMRELKSEMKKPGGDAFAKAYQKSVGEVQRLNRQLEKQKAKIDGSRKAMSEQGFEMNNLAGQHQKLGQANELHGKKIAAMRTLGVKSYAEIDRKVKGLHEAYDILQKDPSITARELALAKTKMEADIVSITGKTNKWASKVDAVKSGFVGLAGLAAGGYLLGNMVQQVGEGAKELQNFARTANTSVEEFSATAFAVKDVGIESDKLADISKDVREKLGDYLRGEGGEFKDFFEIIAPKIDLTAEKLKGLSGPDVLQAVKNAMDELNVSSEEQIVYLEDLASDASLLIPLLEDNGRALKEKADRARELGLTISEMDNTKLVEMAEKTKELTETGGALSREIISALAPSLMFLMGQVQQVVAWFNELSPGVQKFLIYGGLAIVTATGLGMAFYPLFASISMGVPALVALNGGLATSIPFLASVRSQADLATLSATKFGLAVSTAGLATAYLAGLEIGKFLNQFQWAQELGLALTQTFVMLALRAKQAWAWVSGGDTEGVAAEIERAQETFAQMYKDIASGASTQIDTTKSAQTEITKQVADGAKDQLGIAKKTSEEMAKIYASIAPGSAIAIKVGAKALKEGKTPEVDYLGRTKKEQAEAKAKGPKKVYGKNGKWQYEYGKQEGLKDMGNGYYSRAADNLQSRVNGLPDISGRVKAKEEVTSKKVVELKLGNSKLQGSQGDVDSFLEELQRSGLQAS